MKTVQLVEFAVQNQVLPLTSGYLQAYAAKNADIADNYSFSQVLERLTTPRDRILQQLLQSKANIYAFSCYVWNMGLVRDVVSVLAHNRPEARIVLGGPQVVGHGAKYLERHTENVYICNGEGEPVLRDFLKADLHGTDFGEVRGLTFWHDGQLVTTPAQPLIRDINDIPSPFLSGLFKSKYSMTIFETNRGCPYQCTFCYWGRGDDLSVRKFDEQRVREELEWIAKAKILMVFIADANWGLLPRDVAISEYMVELKKRHGFPMIVNFSAAKDKPQASAKIATMFARAGIITSQALGIQSNSDVVLTKIKRKNIKLEVLQQVRTELDANDVSTFVELIWPLPGETPSSFRDSLNKMCTADVSTIVVYPALLLHSTPLESQVEELGIVAKRTLAPTEELELIVETNEVREADYTNGMWTVFGLYTLYNCCALRHTGKYLRSQSIANWGDLFFAFGEYCRSREVAISSYWRDALQNMRQADFAVLGRVVHEVLHAHRGQFVLHLSRFVEAQPWWKFEEARALFELDLVDLPYVYAPKQVYLPPYGWKHVQLERRPNSELSVTLTERNLPLFENSLFGKHCGIRRYRVTYMKHQFPFMPSKSVDDNAAYCHGMIQRLAAIRPAWLPQDSPVVDSEA